MTNLSSVSQRIVFEFDGDGERFNGYFGEFFATELVIELERPINGQPGGVYYQTVGRPLTSKGKPDMRRALDVRYAYPEEYRSKALQLLEDAGLQDEADFIHTWTEDPS